MILTCSCGEDDPDQFSPSGRRRQLCRSCDRELAVKYGKRGRGVGTMIRASVIHAERALTAVPAVAYRRGGNICHSRCYTAMQDRGLCDGGRMREYYCLLCLCSVYIGITQAIPNSPGERWVTR